MQIDLERKIKKVDSTESERERHPRETIEMVKEAFSRINLKVDVELWNHQDIFWTSRARIDQRDIKVSRPLKGLINGGRASEGKGLVKEQSIAACLMEVAERFTLAQHVDRDDMGKYPFHCLNLRSKSRDMALVELTNAGYIGAGNSYEECILHALHETIELTPPGTQFKPIKVVNIENMFTHWPGDLLSSLIVFLLPSDKDRFYRVVAIRSPIDNSFDPDWKIVRQDQVIFKKQVRYHDTQHTRHAGSAAGLNPRLVIQRAVMETFQGPDSIKEIWQGKKKDPPDYIQVVDGQELVNYDTDSITGDVKVIMEALGEDAYVGAIDLSSPDLGIPVVRVFAEYFPATTLGSREIMGMFFECPDKQV